MHITIVIASVYVKNNCEGAKDSHSTRKSTAMWNAVFLGVTFWWLHMTRDAGKASALWPRDTYGKYKDHKEIILKPVLGGQPNNHIRVRKCKQFT